MVEKNEQNERYYTVDIIVIDRNNAYSKVNELLHQYSDIIKLRVGYPVPDENIAIVFLIVKATNDIVGAFTGKIGNIKGVKVKSIAVN
ncbi:MAG TPA: iron-only hydrogenase system regulator [Fervidobacterium nodosum]|nr:iron-only hydrogenase system regulator [Fervidobacterium nodosum]